MPYDYPTLQIEADVDDDGSNEKGIFKLVGDVQVAEQVQIDYVASNKGQKINAILRGTDQLTEEDLPTADRRQGIWIDVGAGSHIYEIQFTGWEGAVDGNDNPVQWGNTGNPDNLTKADATGSDVMNQIQIFNRYLLRGTTDSVNPATFHVGQYRPGGLYEPLEVAIQGPKHVRNSQSPQTFDGTFTVVALESVEDFKDALSRVEY